MNPQYINNLYIRDSKSNGRQNDHVISARKTVTYHDKSIGVLGPQIWYMLPNIIKSAISSSQFKNLLRLWFGPKCRCRT